MSEPKNKQEGTKMVCFMADTETIRAMKRGVEDTGMIQQRWLAKVIRAAAPPETTELKGL